MATWWQQVLSLGAAGRIDEANDAYRATVGRYHELAKRIEARRAKAQEVMERLVETKMAAVAVLGKVEAISRNLATRHRDLTPEVVEEDVHVAIKRIDGTLGAAKLALAGAKGLAAGLSTAAGAWALVGTYGAASTGTAIATLSGAAAESATLAWFGGGAVAAGGAGTAAGAAVIGGIVAVPAILVLGYLVHSNANEKIRDIEREAAKVDQAVDELMKLELVVEIGEKRALELLGAIDRARDAFEHQLSLTHQRVCPRRWLSRAWKKLRLLFGGSYFSREEVVEVQKLLQVAAEFARIIDQPVFEKDGSVRKG